MMLTIKTMSLSASDWQQGDEDQYSVDLGDHVGIAAFPAKKKIKNDNNDKQELVVVIMSERDQF